MCNLYTAVSNHRLMAQFGRAAAGQTWLDYIAPLLPGPYIRQAGEVEVGQWGMIAQGNKTRTPMGQTNNARRETLAVRGTYTPSWLEGKRCLIPAEDFVEPYYPPGSTKSISWRFRRADGQAWALAGIWSEWTDPDTGEVVPNYSMITQNCDAHPLLKLMHKAEVDAAGTVLPSEKQDKRAVVPLEREKWDEWLHGTVEQAEGLIQLPAVELFTHGAGDLPRDVPLFGASGFGELESSPNLLW